MVAGDSIEVKMLGGAAEYPTGAYVVAAAARAPMVQVFAVCEGSRRYSFHGLPAGTLAYEDRRNMRADLHRWAGDSAAHVEESLRHHPHHWGNFFPFFAADRAVRSLRGAPPQRRHSANSPRV